ncbi:MAG: VOC family protein [Acidimicrobiia bacterium]
MTLDLDHLIVCVEDLDDAAAVFETRHGLRAVEGGRHPGHGTANRIIPLGRSYVELLAVIDRDEAQRSSLGAWALAQAEVADGGGVCLRTDDLDAVCQRLGLESVAMSRLTPEGVALTWRVAGIEEALIASRPFFIQWDIPDELHPGRVSSEHPAGQVRLTGVALAGDREYVAGLEEWAPQPGGLTYEVDELDRPRLSYRFASSPEGGND